MRVAIITESFPPDVNGVAHCVLRVAELLTSHGHPLVIAPQPPRAARDEKAAYPFPVVRVPAVPLPGYPGFRLGLPGRRVRAALIRHRAELASRTSGCGPLDLVEDGVTGYLVPPADPGAFTAAAARLAADPATRVAFGAAGRREVLGRTWPALTEELTGHCTAVLRSQGGKGARKPAKVTL